MKKYYNAFKRLLYHTYRLIIPTKTKQHYDVVVVKADLIGDCILWLGTIKCYQETYKDKKVLLICPDTDKFIVESLNFFSDIITFSRKKFENDFQYYRKFISQLRYISSELVINPTRNHNYIDDFICGAIQAKDKYVAISEKRITIYSFIDKFILYLVNIGIIDMAKWYYNHNVRINTQNDSEIEALQNYTRQVINPDFNYHLADLSHITSGYISTIEGDYCVISLSSSRIIKNWPIENLSDLIKYIPKNYTVVLSGYGDIDKNKAEYIINQNGTYNTIINKVNKTTVLEMIQLISKAKFVIGNDSAAIHIAAACRVRSLCLLHGANLGEFVPYPDFIDEKEFHPVCVYKKLECFGCGYNCNKDFSPYKSFYCLRQVTVEMAKEKLQTIINDLKNI